MVIAIAYCHHDSDQTLRLLRWIRFLSRPKCPLLLVSSRGASKMRRRNDIVIEALKTFDQVYAFTPDGEREEGWPVSANFMFRETLEHCERHFPDRDVFWLEPDAVPVTKTWFESIVSDHQDATLGGKTFTGGHVRCSPPHMTGNGIYGSQWRRYAPLIAESVDVPWDVYAGNEIWQNAFITPKIQHCWTRVSGHGITDLGVLQEGVDLFHQDKTGTLMRLLDAGRFSGKCFKGRQDIIQRVTFMRKYFQSDNITREPTALGIAFRFEATDQLAGTWRGVYSTDSEQELLALNALASHPPSGVHEITAEEYEAKLKKNGRSLPPSSPAPQATQVVPSLREKAGVVVESPISPNLPIPQSPAVVPQDIADVLETGKVEMVDPGSLSLPPEKYKHRKKS